MKWNNRHEKARFDREQEKLKEQYKAAGMTDEQIQTMYDFDLSEFNGSRREAEHTHRLDEADLDNETVEIESGVISRYAWIDEIGDERIAAEIKRLSTIELELLTKYIVDGYSLTEIARIDGVSQQAISKKFQKIKNIFLNWL